MTFNVPVMESHQGFNVLALRVLSDAFNVRLEILVSFDVRSGFIFERHWTCRFLCLYGVLVLGLPFPRSLFFLLAARCRCIDVSDLRGRSLVGCRFARSLGWSPSFHLRLQRGVHPR